MPPVAGSVISTRLAARKVLRNASGVEVSGRGASARTARPKFTRISGAWLPAVTRFALRKASDTSLGTMITSKASPPSTRLRIAPVSTTVTSSLWPDFASNCACVSAMTSRMPLAEITLISAAWAAAATSRSAAAIGVLIMLNLPLCLTRG